MPKLLSLFGKTPKRLVGDTFKNSLTTLTDSKEAFLELVYKHKLNKRDTTFQPTTKPYGKITLLG